MDDLGLEKEAIKQANKSRFDGLNATTEKDFADTHVNWANLINTQTLDLRKKIYKLIKKILIGEIIFLALIILLQGFKPWNFYLNHWFFGIFANACLVQTFFLAKCIVSHVFPDDPKGTAWYM